MRELMAEKTDAIDSVWLGESSWISVQFRMDAEAVHTLTVIDAEISLSVVGCAS